METIDEDATMRAVYFLPRLLLAILCCSCATDKWQLEDDTILRLDRIAMLVRRLAVQDLESIHSIADLAQHIPHDEQYILYDAWGRPFVIKRDKDADEAKIHIFSDKERRGGKGCFQITIRYISTGNGHSVLVSYGYR